MNQKVKPPHLSYQVGGASGTAANAALNQFKYTTARCGCQGGEGKNMWEGEKGCNMIEKGYKVKCTLVFYLMGGHPPHHPLVKGGGYHLRR